jgi:hypothetical protein
MLLDHHGAYFQQTSGATSIPSHNQYGHSHTPKQWVKMDIVTPKLLPLLEDSIQPRSMEDIPDFPLQTTIKPQYRHNYDPFEPLQSSLPHSFRHQTPGSKSMDLLGDRALIDDSHMTTEMNDDFLSNERPVHHTFEPSADLSVPNRLRFSVTLNAPTAMINQADGIPLTYLNKGHAYSVAIVDTAPPLEPTTVQYRTAIRISFKDEHQRQTPAKYWQFWKEGRRTGEVHGRGGKMQAVEFLKASGSPEMNSHGRTAKLHTTSVDGFSVLWTAGADDTAACNITLRFNFLSTEFSHSKGVKGAICRLCAKTEVVSYGSEHFPQEIPEICFCEVKLFRHHGAERKLQNDATHAEKAMGKLVQEIAMAEIERGELEESKGSPLSISNVTTGSGFFRVPKRKSISSTSSRARKAAAKEDLGAKFQRMQESFTSTQPSSIFYFRGQERDDPDLHPVLLDGEACGGPRVDPHTSTVWQQAQEIAHFKSEYPAIAASPILCRCSKTRSRATTGVEQQQSNVHFLVRSLAQPIKVQSPQQGSASTVANWIEVLEVDSSYKPPLEPPAKPGGFTSLCTSE